MTTAFLFPGQGAQGDGVLRQLPQHVEIERTIAEANAVLGQEVSALDEAEPRQSTSAAQIVLLVAGVATARALRTEQVHPGAVAGMSVGAFAAAVVCGAMDFPDALRLVQLRGELMQAAFPSGFGLSAILGLDELRVSGLVEQIRAPASPVYIANINAPLQIVIAGSDSALSATATLAIHHGARRVERLAVAVPSHCPLLQPVADRLAEALSTVPLRPPAIPYVNNRGGRTLYDVEAIREDLAANVAHPVRWYDGLEVLRELGTNLFLEMVPGHVSTQIISQSMSGVRAISIADRGLRFAAVAAARQE